MTAERESREPLMLLVEQIGAAQLESTKEQHAIRLLLTELQGDMKALRALGAELNTLRDASTTLRLESQSHAASLSNHSRALDSLTAVVSTLQAANNRRGGWEGFGGKLLYLAGGALITLMVGLLQHSGGLN